MSARRADMERLVAELQAGRARLLALLDAVPDAVLAGQHWPLMGPILWDLGHVACFERIWLVDALDGRPAELPALFDAFVHARSTRGSLDLPDRASILAELASVRERALLRVDRDVGRLTDGGFVWALIAQHEAWHTETALASLGLHPELVLPRGPARRPVEVVDDRRVEIPGGDGWIGTDDASRAYDNERPRHRARVEPFQMDAFPVTVRRWEAFVDDGGYRTRTLWSDAGWDWRTAGSVASPHFWEGEGVRRYGVIGPRVPSEPVQHVSFFEAEAFARWAGGRLPTEAEWEAAACWGRGAPDVDGADLASDALGPAPVGTCGGEGASGCQQMLGGVWEWTSSAFEAYPGFEPWPYREYSAPFFGTGQPVLRGGCWATGRSLARPTLRSWDLPQRRETIFVGLRLAWDA